MGDTKRVPAWKKNLEGTLWILDFNADYIDESDETPQTLFEVDQSKFSHIWDPLTDMNRVRMDNLDAMRAYLKRKDVRELYTFAYGPKIFLDYKLKWSNGPDWGAYDALGGGHISNREDKFRSLDFNGITLLVYDATSHRVMQRIESRT